MAVHQPTQRRARAPSRPARQSTCHGGRMPPEQYLALPEEKRYLFEGTKNGVQVVILSADCLPGFELPLAELFAIIDED